MNNEIIDIVLCIDENFLIPGLVTIRSILDNTNSNIRFNILISEGLSNKLNKSIEKNNFKAKFRIVKFIPSIRLIDILNKYKKSFYCKLLDNHSKITFLNFLNYSRFYVAEYFNDLDIYIYLDIDIVCIDDISKLYKLFNKTKYNFAAVPLLPLRNRIDFNHTFMKNKSNLKNKYLFNTGVYITKNKFWINKNISNKLENIMLANISEDKELYISGTQIPINLIFANEYQYINNRWNNITKYYDKGKKLGIIHFKGKRKPWVKKQRKENNFNYNKLWDKYKKKIVL